MKSLKLILIILMLNIFIIPSFAQNYKSSDTLMDMLKKSKRTGFYERSEGKEFKYEDTGTFITDEKKKEIGGTMKELSDKKKEEGLKSK
jgi:hypothetical protein